jgi:hypothetical protein
MPVFDCNDYSKKWVDHGVKSIKYQLDELSKRPSEGLTAFYLNVYFGCDAIKFADNAIGFHVCRDYGHAALTVAFYEMDPHQVLKHVPDHLIGSKHTYATIVWMAEEFSEDLLDLGLEALDDIVKNIELATGRACILPMCRYQLPEKFVVGSRHPDGRKGRGTIQQRGIQRPLVDREQTLALSLWDFDKRASFDDLPTPAHIFRQAAVWQRKAIRALAMGDTEFVAIASETWIEVFAIRSATELNKLVGTPIPDTKRETLRGIARFIVTWLGSKHFGGRWDHTAKETEFGRWHSSCLGLRNEVVHGGRHPTLEEAQEAYDAAHKLIWHFTEQLAKVRAPELSEFRDFFSGIAAGRRRLPPS